MNSNTYFTDLIKTFPNLSEEISLDMGNHFKMEEFANYTIMQIKKLDIAELKKCFDFQEVRINSLDTDMINAMTVSYCESLLLGEIRDTMPEIFTYMGPKLLKMYLEHETYYNNLGSI